MSFSVCGLSHKTASIELRERVSIGPSQIIGALSMLREYPSVTECMILSTCGRTEIYAVTSQDGAGEHHTCPARKFLLDYHQMKGTELEPFLYHYTEREAIRHLFMVACGLDSMVLGENQVLGQLKDAFEAACNARCNGRMVNRLAHAAFREGKVVRTNTGLNKGSLSVSHVACDLAASIFPDLPHRRLLVIGAGETGELTARNMVKRGVQNVVVANRTRERAEELAEELQCEVSCMTKLAEALAQADIVVGCTASREPVVTQALVEEALKSRSENGTLLFLDLAIPRDIEESVADLDNVRLYNIDHLQEISARNAESRRAEYDKAVKVVDEAVEKFEEWQSHLTATPTIRDLQNLFEGIRQEELQRSVTRMTTDEYEKADKLTKAIVNRIARLAINNMKSVSNESGAQDFLDSVRRLFDLEGESQ